MKKMVLVTSVAIAVALSCSVPAQAKKTKLGLYNAAGLQEICLVNNGTWYSPTFANWGGVWLTEHYSGEKLTLMGNYNSGAGNDSLVVDGTNLIWNEWSDDLGFVNPIGNTTFTFIGSSCTAPLPKNTVNKTRNPAD